MMLSDEMVQEFVDNWRETFGEEIAVPDARIRAAELISLSAAMSYQTSSGTPPPGTLAVPN
jgi:hypothetical protein